MLSLSEKLGAPPTLSISENPRGLSKLDLEITVATPMAGGGFEAGEVDRKRPVRVPSIRGHLRYWWRLMNPKRLTDEAKIWGSTEQREVSNKVCKLKLKPCGKVFIDIMQQPQISFRDYRKSFDFVDANGREKKYGPEAYALFPFRQQGSGHDIAHENFSFTLSLKYPKEFENDIKTALSAWIYFGGIGARTRRGLGSLSCKNFDLISIEKLLANNPEISLWKKSNKNVNALTAWTEALTFYMKYRQYRNPGVNKKYGRTKWTEPDSLRKITGKSAPLHKKPITSPIPSFPRAALGLPIIFQFMGNPNEPDGIQLKPKNSGRMSSPVITKALYENGMWYPAVVILPHDDIFNSELELVDKNKNYAVSLRRDDSYKAIEPMKGTSDAVAGFEKYISNAGFFQVSKGK